MDPILEIGLIILIWFVIGYIVGYFLTKLYLYFFGD